MNTMPAIEFSDPKKVESIFSQMASGKISQVMVPMPTDADHGALAGVFNISNDQLINLKQSNLQINLHFDKSELDTPAFKAIESIATPPGIKGPTLTLKQGVIGGAVIGGIGGFGIATLCGFIKTSADATSNPVLMAIGAIATGLAIGSLSGTALATGHDLDLHIGKTGVGVTTPKASAG